MRLAGATQTKVSYRFVPHMLGEVEVSTSEECASGFVCLCGCVCLCAEACTPVCIACVCASACAKYAFTDSASINSRTKLPFPNTGELHEETWDAYHVFLTQAGNVLAPTETHGTLTP